jgi:hypothetical protein
VIHEFVTFASPKSALCIDLRIVCSEVEYLRRGFTAAPHNSESLPNFLTHDAHAATPPGNHARHPRPSEWALTHQRM